MIATGIDNSVGHAFDPEDYSLWITVDQVDVISDDRSPGELNKMPPFGM